MSEEEEFEFRLRYEREQAKPKAEPGPLERVKNAAISDLKGLRDLVAGGVRGAGSLGATIVAPYDIAKDALAGKGLSLESNRERRAGMDGFMQDVVGADTDSLAYGAGKLGGEIAGTAGVGGVIARGAAAVPGIAGRAPGFIDAIRTAGLRAGGRTGVASLPARAAGGAVTGGASAALVSPEDAAVGAGVGAALPGAIMAAGRVGQAVAPIVSRASAARAATGRVADAVGDRSSQVIGDIQTYYPRGAENIPVSAAGIAGDFNLAQLEQASRLRNPAAWAQFDERQGRAVFDNVMAATGEADELGSRLAQRSQNWADNWAKASAAQKPRIWKERMTQFGADMETALRSPDASNPAVRNVLEAINAEIDRVGPSFSLGNLQQLRANLNGKTNPMSPDVFKSAPRESPAVRSLIAEMDSILNGATGGKWDAVRQGYAADSTLVGQSKAAQKVRGSFVDADTGRITGKTVDADGDVARVTEAGLSRALNAARLPDKTLALSPQAMDRLDATLGVLRRQGVVQNLKRSSTAGGGSDTVSNAISLGATEAAPSWLVQALNLGRRVANGRTDQEMARLLADPDSLAAALERYALPQQAPGALGLGATRALPAIVSGD